MMLLASLMTAVAVPQAVVSADMCDLGRVALRDLPAAEPVNGEGVSFIDASRPDGLMHACPALQHELPAGYALADDAARARASVHAPTPGQQVTPATIYTIDLPKLAADGKAATVAMQYDCTGLCGGGFLTHYVRTSDGWRRQGDRQMLWVS